MRNSFRQGLISYTKDGSGAPQFLLPAQVPGFVTLSVSPTPVLVTFAHGSSEYLQEFDSTEPIAWGPLLADQDNYLYWDIDLLTSQVTYRITTLEPVVSLTEPERVEDQHWFDLRTNKLKVWSNTAAKWLEKVRVFAGVVQNGNVSQLIANVAGSQIGITEPTYTGFIMLDSQLRPLRTSTGEFLTTDTPVRIQTTVGTSGVLAVPPNAFIPVRAGENIPAMSVVCFSGEDTVSLASSDPTLINQKTPIGIVQAALSENEVGVITQTGDITWDQWDWAASIGKPLYVDNAGQLTPTRPQGLLAYRVGFVKNRNTILFNVDAETNAQVYTVTGNEVVVNGAAPLSTELQTNSIGERVITISLPSASALIAGYMTTAQATIVAAVTPHFTTIDADLASLHAGKANVVHTHRLQDLEQVNILAPSNDDVLSYENGEWISRTLNFDNRYAILNHNHDGRYAPLVHTHVIADVTGLQNTLNSKASRPLGLLSFDRVFTTIDQTDVNDIGNGQTLAQVLVNKANVSDIIHDLAALDDVNVTNATNNQVLTFLNGTWMARPVISVRDGVGTFTEWFPTSLAFTGNVQITATGTNVVLNVPGAALDDLTNVNAPLPGDGDVLAWGGTEWRAEAVVVPSLDDLTDVSVPSPAEGEVLTWSGTEWEAVPIGAALLVLDDLTDVSVPSPAEGEVLTWSGTEWEAEAPVVPSLDDLTDVSAPSPTEGEVLTWSGTEWEAEPVPAASLDLDDLTDVSAPAPAEGEVLTWSGTEWAPEALPVLTQVHVIKPSPLSGTSTAGTSLSFGSAAQHNTHFRFTSGTAVTVTVQLDATWSGTQEYWEENYNPSSPQAMPIGGTAIFGKHGAGDITFLPVAGVTIHSPDLLKITKLNGKATLIKAGPNEWDLEGNLATT